MKFIKFLSDIDIRLPAAERQPAPEKGLLKWIWFFLYPYRAQMGFFAVNRLLRYLILAFTPFYIGVFISLLETGEGIWFIQDYWTMLAVFIGLSVFAYTSFLFYIPEAKVWERLIRSMTLYSVSHMMRLSLSWHESQGSGKKMERIMHARRSLKELSLMYAYDLVPFMANLIALCITVPTLNASPIYILIIISMIVSYFILSVYLLSGITKRYDHLNKAMEDLSARVYDFVTNIRTSKIFNVRSWVMNEAMHREEKTFEHMAKIQNQSLLRWFWLNYAGLVWWVLAISYGGWQVMQDELTIGAFSAIIFFLITTEGHLENFARLQIQFYEYRTGFLRLRETLKEQPEVLDTPPVIENWQPNWTDIRLKNISFAYPGRDVALKNISLDIKRGQKIALIGPSGGGKSTLTKILFKQAWPQEGDIYVDDVQLKHIPVNDWLAQMTLVPQDVELFDAPLRDNVLLDHVNCDQDIYESALKRAQAWDFIQELPDGDMTLVGERGIKLSGGQRQRIGIARALVRQTDLVILDEATSALDSGSEAAIQTAIENSFKDHTMVVIAHRLSTIKSADVIYVIDSGEIVESGTFKDLSEKDGLFSTLWGMQSRGFLGKPSEQV